MNVIDVTMARKRVFKQRVHGCARLYKPLFATTCHEAMLSETTSLPAVKVEDLWFDDGNLVVRCGEKLFKVHKGLLASLSPIWRDMFALGSNASSTGVAEDYEGTALVNMPDKPEDMEPFLRVVYHLR